MHCGVARAREGNAKDPGRTGHHWTAAVVPDFRPADAERVFAVTCVNLVARPAQHIHFYARKRDHIYIGMRRFERGRWKAA